MSHTSLYKIGKGNKKECIQHFDKESTGARWCMKRDDKRKTHKLKKGKAVYK